MYFDFVLKYTFLKVQNPNLNEGISKKQAHSLYLNYTKDNKQL